MAMNDRTVLRYGWLMMTLYITGEVADSAIDRAAL
jgi:hypothetical protein